MTRYDDRDLVTTNLIDSYDRILDFVRKYLPDPFYLEGIERRSLRDTIFREVASNILIHREYTSGSTTRLIIEYGRVVQADLTVSAAWIRRQAFRFRKTRLSGRFSGKSIGLMNWDRACVK